MFRQDQHLSNELISRLRLRDLSREELIEVASHLSCCKQCRLLVRRKAPREAKILGHLTGIGPSGPKTPYSEVIARAHDSVRARLEEIRADLLQAPQSAQALLALEEDERRERLSHEGAPVSRGLVEHLLNESRTHWILDQDKSIGLARAALDVIDVLPNEQASDRVKQDLRAQAWAYIGNCQRIRGELSDSDSSFRRAEEHMRQGTTDLLVRAEVLDLKASLLRSQRRFREALETLDQVSGAYRRIGDQHLVGRVLLSKALVHDYAGETEVSVELVKRARELVDTAREPRLAWVTAHQLADFLNTAGRPEEAKALLPEVRAAARACGGPLDELRVVWREGNIAANLGDFETAESAFRKARNGFVERGIGYDAAIASLDLASIYLQQGRSAEAKELASEMYPIFQTLDIHREALAALLVFCRAAEMEAATIGMVEDIGRFLEKARENPSLHFETPS